MSIVRVKPGIECTVYVEELDSRVSLVPDKPFDSKDPVVKQCPWAFAQAGEETARTRKTSVRVGVEEATAAPGELRNR